MKATTFTQGSRSRALTGAMQKVRDKKKKNRKRGREYFHHRDSKEKKQEGDGRRKSGIIFLLWQWHALNIQERFLRLTTWKQLETDRGQEEHYTAKIT